MQHEINTIIHHDGKHFKVTESGKYPVMNGCGLCAFGKQCEEDYEEIYPILGHCSEDNRLDGKNVYFVEVDAGGNPIEKPVDKNRYLTFSDDELIFGDSK